MSGDPPATGDEQPAGRWTLIERDRVRLAFGWLIAATGLLNLYSAVSRPLPSRFDQIKRLVPLEVPHVANVAVVMAGLLLLFLARQLARGKHRAWQAAVALLSATMVLHLVKALDIEEAVVAGGLVVALVLARGRFRAASDAPSFARLVRLGPLLVAFPFVYGMAGLYLRRNGITTDLSFGSAVIEVASRMIGFGGPLGFTGRFGRWFPVSITALAALSAVYILFLAFRPVVGKVSGHSPSDEQALRSLVRGDDDTLAYFLLRDDKAFFFDASRRAVLGYRAVGGVALVSGDPVGPSQLWPGLLADFLGYAHERGWRVAALAVTEPAAQEWERKGLRCLYLGDEAILDPRAFSLEGRAIRKVRQACTNAERQGYRIEFHRVGEMHPDLRRALLHVSDTWRGEDEERGFSMTLGRLFDGRDPDCLVAVTRDGEGLARGFLHFVPVGSSGYSLDVIRRDADTPSGLNEFLIARTLEHLGAEGVELVSLNFAFLRGILRPAGRLTAGQRFQKWLAERLGPWFQIESLYRFNNKFGPTWRPRYAAYENALAIPQVLLAAMRAEKLLDLTLLRRGQGGKRSRVPAAERVAAVP